MNAILNRDKKIGVRAAATRTLTLAVTVLALAGLYELYRWVWVTTGWT